MTTFRCHDADACAFGQKPCPTPRACGCEAPGRYHVVAINEKTGRKEYLTEIPLLHGHARNVLKAQRPHLYVRKQLERA